MVPSFVAYCFVSGICLVLNNTILIVADLAGCTLLSSVLLSYSIVVVVGYLLHSLISFRQPFGIAAFGRYALGMAPNIPLMFATIGVSRDVVGLPMSSSAPIATACMVLINYLICRWAISRNHAVIGPSEP